MKRTRNYDIINKRDGRGQTSLHRAAYDGDHEKCKWLLERRADPSIKDNDGWTAFGVAANESNIETLQVLLNFGEDINAKGCGGCCTYLCTLSTFVNDTGEEEGEQIETLKMLIKEGANVNERCDFDGETPLIVAAVSAFPEIITILVEAGADLEMKNDDGNTPLMVAADSANNPEMVNQFIEYGANIDETNKEGQTVLIVACTDFPEWPKVVYCGQRWSRRESIVKRLLEAGADIDVVDNIGNTALIYAGQIGLWKAAYLMLKLSREHTDKEYKRFLFRAERL